MSSERRAEESRSPVSDRAAHAIAAAMVSVAKALRTEVPPPKGLPFYGLDLEIPQVAGLLPALSSQGIFRKYEFVLELDSGWGGRARWAARHFGCRVLGVEPSPEAAGVARLLGEYARSLDEAVFCAGCLDALPFCAGAFTHAWWLAPSRGAAIQAVLREVWRVLRDGGYFAWLFDLAELSADGAAGEAREAGFSVGDCQVLVLPPVEVFWQVAHSRLEKSLRAEPAVERRWRMHMGAMPEEGRRMALLFARRQFRRKKE